MNSNLVGHPSSATRAKKKSTLNTNAWTADAGSATRGIKMQNSFHCQTLNLSFWNDFVFSALKVYTSLPKLNVWVRDRLVDLKDCGLRQVRMGEKRFSVLFVQNFEEVRKVEHSLSNH